MIVEVEGNKEALIIVLSDFIEKTNKAFTNEEQIGSLKEEIKENIEKSLLNSVTFGKIGDLVLQEFNNINFDKLRISLVETSNGYVIKPPVNDRSMGNAMFTKITKPLMKDVHDSVKEFLNEVKYCADCKISDTENDECEECGKKLKEVDYELY